MNRFTPITSNREFLISVCIAVVVAFAGSAILYHEASHSLRQETRSRLESIAANAVLMIDPKLHETIISSEDESKDAYKAIKATLLKLRKVNPDLRNIYTMRRTNKKNTWQFVVDSELDPKLLSHVGDKYDVTEYPEMQKAFEGPAADVNPSQDKWGTWLSGYAPIRDASGHAVAILGLDMSLDQLRKEESYLKGAAIRNALISLLISLILCLIATRVLLKLIDKLKENAEKLQRNHDEIARLKMVSDELLSMTDLPTELKLILKAAVESVDADRASIMLRDKNSDILYIKASHNIPQEFVESTTLHVEELTAGLAAESCEPITASADNVSCDTAMRITLSEPLNPSAIIPIQLGDEVRGLIGVARDRYEEPFGEDNLGLLSALANTASLAIQKAELLIELMDKIDMLAATLIELQRTQAGLMQAEKLSSIGQMAGSVAHEINNPLQAILGRTELLIELETDELKLHDMNLILEHTVRIADIVSNLLNFSRKSSNTQFKDTDVNDVIRKTLNLIGPQIGKSGVTTELKLTDNLPAILGNPGQLQQIFTNICMNACQAMRDTEDGSITISTALDDNMVVVQFQDNGPGIPPDVMDHLFEPFFTTKAEGEGTGLGMSISYGIAKAHGGDIQVQSTLGNGACFIVSIPMKLDPSTAEN